MYSRNVKHAFISSKYLLSASLVYILITWQMFFPVKFNYAIARCKKKRFTLFHSRLNVIRINNDLWCVLILTRELKISFCFVKPQCFTREPSTTTSHFSVCTLTALKLVISYSKPTEKTKCKNCCWITYTI